MEAKTKSARIPFWIGWVLTGLIVLFMTFDGVMKVVKAPPVLEACAKLGIPTGAIVPIGVVLLACTAFYAIPRTAVLGAILLTGYLGGAVATHVLSGGEPFTLAFSSGFGVLAWLGLALRDPRLFRIIFNRGAGPL